MTSKRQKMEPHLPPRLIGAGKRLLQWLIVTAGIFLWWLAVLLLFSLILVNTWHVSFDEILKISLLLTVLCSAGYALVIIARQKRG